MKNASLTLSALSAFSLCAAAGAQTFEFEPPAYHVGILGGQQGWVTNALPTSIWTDQFVVPYGPNPPYGIAPNPGGGLQFVAGRTQDGPLFAGSNHPIDFSAGGVWTVEWDCLGLYNGGLPASDNLGGLRVGTPGGTVNYWQSSLRWSTHLSTADRYDMTYWQFPAVPGPGYPYPPGPAWTNIPVNHWIHQSATWSSTSNRILLVSIRDITAGGPTTTLDLSSQEWYLSDGANTTPALPLPVGISMFSAGGITNSQGGNITAWDNIRIIPPCYANCDASTLAPVLNVNDFTCFVNQFAAGVSYANCDGSTSAPVLNVNDFTCFLNKYAAGCSS